jgi:hypothetical protein
MIRSLTWISIGLTGAAATRDGRTTTGNNSGRVGDRLQPPAPPRKGARLDPISTRDLRDRGAPVHLGAQPLPELSSVPHAGSVRDRGTQIEAPELVRLRNNGGGAAGSFSFFSIDNWGSGFSNALQAIFERGLTSGLQRLKWPGHGIPGDHERLLPGRLLGNPSANDVSVEDCGAGMVVSGRS